MFFIICLILTTYILYNSINSINTTYNQVKKADIFLADSGNNFYPESDNSNNDNYNIYGRNENCFLCYLMGLNEL